MTGYQEVEGKRMVGVKRDGVAKMLAKKRTVETGSLFCDRDEVISLR